MPTYEVTSPDGRTFEVTAPEGASQQDVLSYAQANFTKLAKSTPKERTYGEAFQDVGAKALSGIGGLAQLPGQLYGLATGNFEDTGLYGAGKKLEQYGESLVSPALKAKEAATQQKIAEAEKEGQFAAFKTGLSEIASDPAQLTAFLAQQAPQAIPSVLAAMIPGVGPAAAAEVQAAQAAARAATGSAAKAAAAKALEEAVANATKSSVMRGASAAGNIQAVQQGADIGTGAYEGMYEAMIKGGASPEEAAGDVINKARLAGAGGALLSKLAQRLPGAQAFERALAGERTGAGRLVGAGLGALKEIPGENVEEVGGRLVQNIAQRQVDPEQALTQGLGATAAQATIGAAGLGGLGGVMSGRAAPERQVTPEATGTQEEPVTPEAEPEKLLALGMTDPFKPVELPDGSVATTREDFDAYQEMARRSNGEFPILRDPLTTGTSIGLPSGLVAATPEELDAYRQQQKFGENLLAQPAEVRVPGIEEMTPAGAQSAAAMAGFTGAPNANMSMMERARAIREEQQKTEEKQRKAEIKKVQAATFSADPIQNQQIKDRMLADLGVTPAQAKAVAAKAVVKENLTPEEIALAEAREPLPGEGISPNAGLAAKDVRKEQKQLQQANLKNVPAPMAEADIQIVKDAKDALKEVNSQIEAAKKEGTDLFNRLKGRLNPDDVIDIAPQEKGGRLKMLASKSGGDTISTLVADGSLNEFLPPDMRITEPGQDESAGVEYIKEALRSGDTRSFDSKVALQALEKTKEDLKSRIEQPSAERAANLELSQIAEEQVGFEGLPTEQLVEQAKQLGIDIDTLVQDVANRTGNLTTEQYHGAVRDALISEINSKEGVQTLASVSPVEKNKNGAFAFTTANKAELQMEKDLTGKSIFQAAQYLIDKAPNAFYKFVGKRILDKLNRMQSEGVLLNFQVAGGDRRPTSLYSANGLSKMVFAKDGRPMSFNIMLNGAPIMENQNGYPSGMSYKTLMHELLHTCTQAELKFLNFQDANHPAVRDAIRLYNKVAEEYKAQRAAGTLPDFLVQFDRGNNNALASVDEMITWSMTDERMQKWMSNIKVGEKTLMDKIVELIRKVMGIAKPYETALDRLVRTTDQIIAIDSETLADGVKKAGYSYGPKGGPKRVPKEQQSLFSKAAQAMFEEDTKELKLGKKEEAPTPTGSGVDSMRVLEQLGRANQEAEPGYKEKVRQAWDNARDNPKATAEAASAATKSWLDRVETWAFSSDAGLNNRIRRAIEEMGMASKEKIGLLLNASLSQTVHSDAVASLFLQKGGIKYNDEIHKWEGVESKANFVELSKQLDELATKNGLTKQQAELVAHTAFEAKRLRSMVRFNEELAQKIAEIKAEAAAKRGTSPVAASALSEKASRMQDQFKYISDEQLAMIEPGMSLFKIHPELNKVVDTWNSIRANAVETLIDTGLWSKAEAEEMLANADYVPFYREDQLEQNKGPKEFIRGLQVQAKEKRLKGSDRPVNDIFDNQVRWVQYSINRAVRNRSALALADTAVEVGAATKLTDEQRRGAPNVVRVWRNGQEEFFSMEDPMFVEAFTGLEAIVIPSWKWASNLANMLRQSVVMYPLFSVAQVPQDSFAAMFSSGLKPQYALRIPVLAVKEFVKTLAGKSKTHEELKNVGAVGVRDFTSAMVRLDAEIYAGLKAPPGVIGKLKYGLNHIAMSADNAVRQAVYEASMSQGLSRAEALEKAFDVFNVRRKGSSKSLALAGQLIPFFSAYLAAQNVAYKTITGRGISPTERQDAFKTLAATTASVMTLSLLYAMMNGDDEDYLKKPATVRDRLLMIPGTGGMSIPLRADLFTMPKIITEHMYLMMTDKGYEDGRKFRDSMKAALGSALLGPTAVPQAIKPLVEVGINYDFFQGRPLIGTYQQKLDTERQFTDSTSELGKILGKTGLVSPIAADHLIRGMFGSAGGLIIYATNPMLHSDPNTPRPSLSERDAIAALPGMSGFMMKSYESALKKDFYTLKEEVDKAANTLNDLKTRSPQQIEGFLSNEENLARVGLQKSVNMIGERLSNIRKAITQITNSSMPEDEKQQQIEMLRKVEEEMLKSVDVKTLRQLGKI